ncbi:putative cyclase-domain-containing protein [Colletotrichum cereale]|nr:putative cyclase-domain-containing protein [Colletotrichum cereale]
MDIAQIPDFDDLPPVPGMPKGCAWGVFDRVGKKKDLLGTLNLLTQSVKAAAFAEARDGVSISLNWPLNAQPVPTGRAAPQHRVSTLQEAGLVKSGLGWDDEVSFNTQISSQWDSLAHWPHQGSGQGYNGVCISHAGLTVARTSDNQMPTLDHWHRTGGFAARGVLIDYKRWCEANGASSGSEYDPLDLHRITVADIELIAKAQNVSFRPGDVLIIRTGMTEVLEGPLRPEDMAKLRLIQCPGMHGSLESVRWLWNHHVSAVASDSWGFEALPAVKDEVGSQDDLGEDAVLHPWLLSMFGMPIGELWDLKELSLHCAETGRYSFLLTSAPLNLPGLVASPPNALAMF